MAERVTIKRKPMPRRYVLTLFMDRQTRGRIVGKAWSIRGARHKAQRVLAKYRPWVYVGEEK